MVLEADNVQDDDTGLYVKLLQPYVKSHAAWHNDPEDKFNLTSGFSKSKDTDGLNW